MRASWAAWFSRRLWWLAARSSWWVPTRLPSRPIQAADVLPVPVTLRRADDRVAVEVGAWTGPMRALRVVYDPEHATDVRAGENQGERLRGYRIVREVESLGEWDGGARRFAVKPPGPAQGQVVMVQSLDLRILGAADQLPG
jgi:hypothetical protein